jgi:hypothetical protein
MNLKAAKPMAATPTTTTALIKIRVRLDIPLLAIFMKGSAIEHTPYIMIINS